MHRGPLGISSTAKIIAIGSAHTFGRFSPSPYTSIMTEQYDLPTVNFGMGGKGPAFFLREEIIEAASKFETVIYQLPSGRCVSNSYLSGDSIMMAITKGGMRIPKESIAILFSQLTGQDLQPGDPVPLNIPVRSEVAYTILRANLSSWRFGSLLLETRRNYVKFVREFLSAMPGRTIVLTLSARNLPAGELLSRPRKLGKFPELLTERMLQKINAQADHSIKIIGDEGLPVRIAPIKIADTWPPGAREGLNRYYPSTSLHAKVASELHRVING
nr:DUF6473 family protein [Halovulum dunhuangense]